MSYQSYTLTNLRDRLAARVEASPFWDETEATDALNEWLRTWNMLTGRWVQRVILETTPRDYTYALPASLSYRTRVLFDNRPLSPASREDLNNGRVNWRRETTADGGAVPDRPMLWAPVSLQLLYLWPADAVGHHALTIDGIAATPQLDPLDPDNSYVDLGEDDLSVGLGFALHVLSLKRGSVWFKASLPLFTAFLEAAGLENQLITTSTLYRRWMGLDHRDLKRVRDRSIPSPLISVAATPGSTAGMA